jgi:ribosomal protein L11 methyltransferase
MKWAEISIESSGDEQEIVSALLTEVAGCHGFAATETAVLGYLPVDDRLEETLLRLREAAGVELTIKFVAEEDWANEWKQYFKPQRIGERLVIKPSWETYEKQPEDLVIEMDPGMAFGTGLHATTRLCLRALEKYVVGGESVADIGTGSGVLAIGALLLGAKSGIATDNDPLAVRVATENIALNQLSEEIQAVEAWLPPEGEFEIVVANILPDVILGMAEELVAATKLNGLLITSGIIEARTEDVKTGLGALGIKIIAVETEGEWVSVIGRKT